MPRREEVRLLPLDNRADKHTSNTSAQHPPPKALQAPKLDLSLPHSSDINHVAPVEPSTPLEHGSSSPTLDQYHLSPPQKQARRHSLVDVPHIPPPTLPPIQPHYDVSPPETRLESLSERNIASNRAGEMRSVNAKAPHTNPELSNLPLEEAFNPDVTGDNQDITMEDVSVSTYTAPEAEIAALGLAALDGAQDEEEQSAVKTEAQGLPDLTTVPVSKAVNRPHKVSTSKPSEGSSDKRFLCYICIKLFTRRRSVRDHIKKIHNDSNFDIARAIEVTVDPETGESVIPLAELVKTLPAPSGGQRTEADASHSPSRASSVDTNTFPTPALVTGKKRPAPEMVPAQSTALKKKGTAKPKSVNTGNKKVKPEIDISTDAVAAFRSPSGTPVSARASKPPAASKPPKKQPSMSLASSPAPSDHISIAAATDNEAEDDGEQDYVPAGDADENEGGDDDEVFCICRKGDNHTWMIGCDGGCEDWFHGKCVNIQERDGDLIDKYICPKCEDKGRGQTTWKRMCRREECRKPARVFAEPPSKYCSEECNKRFWIGMVRKSDPNALVSEDGLMVIGSKLHSKDKEKKKRKRKRAKEDSEYNDTNNDDESECWEEGVKMSPSRKKKKSISPTMIKSRKSDYLGGEASSSDDEPPLPTRGGALSVGDIKMMLNQAKTVDEIRHLGRKPPTPPYTSDAEAEDPDTKMVNGVDGEREQEQKRFPYNTEERLHLERLSAKRRRLNNQLQLLRDQEKLLAMIKTRSAAIIEEMDVPKAKNVCGFDARLSWSNAEFEDWRGSPAGRTVLERGQIGDPDPASADLIKEERSSENVMIDGIDGDPEKDYDDDEDDDDGGGVNGDADASKRRGTSLRGICIRNKCPRHRDWRRLLASEYKFEEDGVRRQLRKLDKEGNDVRERAAMRLLCEQE
jgi:PHD-finger